jgi:hypothetical protein
MSGSAGLAAAKRRRAGPSTVINELPKRPSNLPSASQQQVSQPLPQTNISNTHPLIILAQHEQHLSRLQIDLEEMKLNNERNNMQSIPKVDEQSIQFYKKKYEELTGEMDEMKKLLIKIQTFSMETNLEVLKLKKSLNNDEDEIGLNKLSLKELPKE